MANNARENHEWKNRSTSTTGKKCAGNTNEHDSIECAKIMLAKLLLVSNSPNSSVSISISSVSR